MKQLRSKGNRGGRLPDGHPRRCQAHPKNKGGLQCKCYARRGSKYCARHGGRANPVQLNSRKSAVATYYSKRLAGPLKDLFDSAINEQCNDLMEEVALARTVTATTVGVVSKLSEQLNKKKDIAPERVTALMAIVLEQADTVGKMVERQARVTAMLAGKVPTAALQIVIDQIIRVIHRETNGDQDLVERLEVAIREQVRLPKTDDEALTNAVQIVMSDATPD